MKNLFIDARYKGNQIYLGFRSKMVINGNNIMLKLHGDNICPG